MLTSRCFYCERERIIEPPDQPWPFCDDRCEAEFKDVVYALLDGRTLAGMGISPDSELGRRSVAEARRVRFLAARESYEMKAESYARAQPVPGSRSVIARNYRGW